MMTVGELSRQGGIAPHVVRYYARIGLLAPARHPQNNYKLFSSTDLARVRFIRQAQRLGYTLDEIRMILQEGEAGRSPCRKVRDILRRRIEENRYRLVELASLQRRMEDALRRWERLPDADCGEAPLCHLIDAADDDQAAHN